MKIVNVVAAVICNSLQYKEKIFATARGYGEFKGLWEFPGGKVEPNETSVQALKREISEELNISIIVGELIDVIEYDYPKFHLVMHCYWCEITDGQLSLNEALSSKWLTKDTLYSVHWLPADKIILSKIQENLE